MKWTYYNTDTKYLDIWAVDRLIEVPEGMTEIEIDQVFDNNKRYIFNIDTQRYDEVI